MKTKPARKFVCETLYESGENTLKIVLMEKVTFRYGKREVIKDLSLELSSGNFLYVKGHNGSGKSTLLKLICGLFKPNSGRIAVFQKDPHVSPSVLKDVGAVVDGMGLYKDLSLHDNVILFAREKGMNKNEVLEKLKVLEKETEIDFSAKYRKSSHGMRKIAKLVLSLMNSPELLILDEPELALDDKRKEWLASKLKAHKKEGKSAIIAGTNPKQFEDLIDDVLEMKVVM